MRRTLSLPARVVAQLTALRTLLAQIRAPSADTVVALETNLTRLAGPREVDAFLDALRACPETARMLDDRWLPSPYTLDDLAACAPGTLGEAYRRHMVDNALRPDFFGQIDPDDDFAYARLRMFQTHDIWHAVTGYPATVEGEVGIVGFYLGHFDKHMGDRAGGAAAFSAILAGTMVMHAALFRHDLIPVFFRALTAGWARGQSAAPFFAQRWETQWHRPLAELRRDLGVA